MLIVCEPLLALSAMVSVALCDPASVSGVKITLKVQFAPAATPVPQVFVCAKAVGFVPPMVIFEMVSDMLPVFESVTLCAVLLDPMKTGPNVRLGVERLAMGAGGGPLAPPPPHAAQTPTTSNAVANSQTAGRRRVVARLASAASASNPANGQGQLTGTRKLGGTLNDEGGVELPLPAVLTVSVVVTAEEPITLTDAGETEQVSAGHTAQEKFTVPAYPPRGVSVIVVVPDCPGAEILIVDGFADKLKLVMLIVVAVEVVEAA
jgi:hypothetical protein